MKEKFNKFMYNGGFAVIVAVIAMGLYLSVLSGAQKCSADSIEPVEVRIDDEGKLYLHYIYDDKDELMILWETDAGNISIVEDENKLNYFTYGNMDEKIIWDSKDADGNEYEVATVRAILYEKTEEKSTYFIAEAAAEVQISVTYKDGKIVKAEDRMFSNPVRKNSDTNWSQIYVIDENEDLITYRYRTGKEIPEDEYLYLRWEADDSILCETDVHNGLYPKCGVLNSNKNKEKIVQVNTVSVFKEKAKGNIYAFIVGEKYYEQPDVSEKNKINKAELKLN